MRTIKILVTGGGSSGHISPALAIIKTIGDLATGADWRPQFRYIGGTRGIERQQITAAGIEFVGVATGKLRRYFSMQNLTDLFRIPIGVAQALREVARFGPDVLLSTGGYVGVPAVLAAYMLRVPILTHEQTVQVGLANRITARFATTIALTFESARQELPLALRDKAIVTGNPVRPLIFGGDGAAAVDWAVFARADDGMPTIYITGGIQGARVINRAADHQIGQREHVLDLRADEAREMIAPAQLGRQLGGGLLQPFVILLLAIGLLPALVDDPAERQQIGQRRLDRAVDDPRALAAAGDIDRRQPRVGRCEAGPACRRVAIAAEDQRTHGVASHDRLSAQRGRQFLPRAFKRQRDRGCKAGGDPVRQANLHGLLVGQDRHAQQPGCQHRRHADIAARAEHHIRPETRHLAQRLRHANRDAEQIG